MDVLTQAYGGDGLRVKKTEGTVTTYYLRSSVLGNQVIAEIGGSGTDIGKMTRGYVYLGGQLLAVQEGRESAAGRVLWVHQDPVTKSQRLTDRNGAMVSTVDLDPWGGETARSEFQSFQPRRYTTYERDSNGGDEAMFRRYESRLARFSQPDPYDGSYDLSDPQSLNRYSYVQNDPVNFIDPSGLRWVFTQTCSVIEGDLHCDRVDISWVDDPPPFVLDDPRPGGGGGGNGGPQETKTKPIDPCDIATQLPQNGVGFYAKANTERRTQFAKGPTILWVLLFAEEWSQAHPDSPLGIGEISINGGGLFGKHQGDAHKYGLGVDIRLPRLDKLDQGGFDYRSKGIYDQETTRQLANALMADPAVTRVFFNDPAITGSKIHRDSKGVHDNHLHVEVVDACNNPK